MFLKIFLVCIMFVGQGSMTIKENCKERTICPYPPCNKE